VLSSDIIAASSDCEYTIPPGVDTLQQYRPLIQLPINPYNLPLQDWADCLFCSVQSSATSGPILHIPYYRPFLCLLTESLPIHHSIGVEHQFEYHHKITGKPVVVIHLIITPSYHHSDPRWCNSHNPHYQVLSREVAALLFSLNSCTDLYIKNSLIKLTQERARHDHLIS
jgi:hypothetical protein